MPLEHHGNTRGASGERQVNNSDMSGGTSGECLERQGTVRGGSEEHQQGERQGELFGVSGECQETSGEGLVNNRGAWKH